MSQQEAALYEEPFAYVEKHVKPTRLSLRRDWHRNYWWLHGDPRPGLRAALKDSDQYIVTPMVSKHRLFAFVTTLTLPENKAVAFSRNDFTFFGILHSKYHEKWSLNLCSFIGVGNDPSYSPSRCFETFPFPEGLEPNLPAAAYAADPRAIAIAEAARRLDQLRRNWLNPPSHVTILPEVVPGFPDRIVPIDDKAAAVLKKRTLTNLYNERPTWLVNAHRDLDAAVASAYGWPADISEDEALARLLALNHARTVNVSADSVFEVEAKEAEFA
jgi:type II restriction/modification system DNA methylase subunit YeeA